jgi:hypothetical protein
MPDITQLDLDLITMDPEIQTRAVRDEGPEVLPPLVVYLDEGDVYWLADGYHCLKAAREALSKEGPRTLPAEVHEGTKRDAILYAAGANAKHGQPLTSHEKGTVVQRLLKDPEWAQWSDRKIARHIGVSHTFVGALRKELDTAATSGNGGQIPAASTRTVQRGGKTYQMHTGGIGRTHGSQPAIPTAPASSALPQQADKGGLKPVLTQGLDELRRAWYRATLAARRSFRDWVVTQPVGDYGPLKPSERTQHYNDVIAAACKRESDRGA